jgi:GDP-6-deoxy-D-talose 4-dehydrogenase
MVLRAKLNMKILITGINGFVGRILEKTLKDRGHKICGIDVESSAKHVHKTDITDSVMLKRTIHELKPGYIFHLAAISFANHDDAELIHRINVMGTANLLNSAVSLEQKPGFLLVSSSQVYGITGGTVPISEDTPVNPVNHYGASKAAAENIALAYMRDFDLPVVIARPFNHTGIGQNSRFIIPKLVEAYKNKVKYLELGNIDTIREYQDVRDIVDAYIMLMEKSIYCEKINICCGIGHTVRNIISELETLTSHKIDLKTTSGFMRKNEIRYSVGDNALISRITGLKPKYSTTDTLKWMLNSDR